jgi:hypothetical protein
MYTYARMYIHTYIKIEGERFLDAIYEVIVNEVKVYLITNQRKCLGITRVCNIQNSHIHNKTHTYTLEHKAHTYTLEHKAHTYTLEHKAHTYTLERYTHRSGCR